MPSRDYNLLGPDAQNAVTNGLVTENWYKTPIPRQQIKALMRRSDQPALRDTAILFTLMIGFAVGAIAVGQSWWALPLWLAYGVFYGSAMDSRWHECGHGTAFKTRWMNQTLYQIACFCLIRDPHCWKFSHARHHSDTIIVGRDPEIAIMRPPNIPALLVIFFGIFDFFNGFKRMFTHAAGNILPEEAAYVPENYHPAIFRIARIWSLIYLLTLIVAFVLQSWVPVLLIGLPRMYGCWHIVLCGLLQHGGLADNVTDHRLNSRTVYMNPISRFIYWNMNYHIEHHMFPLVPYFRLPELHRALAHDLPSPSHSIFAAYKEMLPAVMRQIKNPEYQINRPLPATANPYQKHTSQTKAKN